MILKWTGYHVEAEDLVQEALAQFSVALNSDRLANFPTLGAILQFLKVITKNLVISQRRREDREQRKLAAWVAEIERHDPVDAESRLDSQALMAHVRSLLQDPEEELVFALSFEFDLSPQQIVARHPDRFSSPQDVYRIKERFMRRLRYDARVRQFVRTQ